MTISTNDTEAYIVEHSKHSGDVRTVTQKDYLGYLEAHHQITEPVVKALANAEKALVTGAVAVATRDLENQIAAAKLAGEDPTEESASVRISRPLGQISTSVQSQRSVTNPSNGQKIVKHGVVTVKIKTGGFVEPDAAAHARETIAKLLGD